MVFGLQEDDEGVFRKSKRSREMLDIRRYNQNLVRHLSAVNKTLIFGM